MAILIPKESVTASHGFTPAWGYDVAGALCIRCACGHWMRIDPGQVDEQMGFQLNHQWISIAGQIVGKACGYNSYIMLQGYIPEEPSDKRLGGPIVFRVG